jgi:2-phospho-L-lactate guanylyltransferase
MRTLAILPVKRFELAKTRLHDQLAPVQRRALAQAMVADVLDTLLATPGLDAVVVTNEPAVASLASARGATVLADRAESGQSDAALIGADRHGSGTNALLLTPPDAIEPGFGPDSFERHRLRASEVGASWQVESPAGLALDVDTPEDLAALRVTLAARETRTSALLAEL